LCPSASLGFSLPFPRTGVAPLAPCVSEISVCADCAFSHNALRRRSRMAKRIVLAGILGAIVMFVWSSVAHIMTSLPAMGIQEIPNEQAVLTAMQAQIG